MSDKPLMLREVKLWMCSLCLDGVGGECHVPGCIMFLHAAPDLPLMPELYEVLSEHEVED